MTPIEKLSLIDLISRLPDDTPLTVEEAAIFCRCSVSRMNKMRMKDYHTKGPDYIQAGREGTRGTNQSVLYMKRDLVAWLARNRVSNTLDAAARKGQLGAPQYFVSLRTMVMKKVAFWRNLSGRIAGLVEKTDVDVFFERLFVWEIVWLTSFEAMEEDWDAASVHEMKSIARDVQVALWNVGTKINSLSERIELNALT